MRDDRVTAAGTMSFKSVETLTIAEPIRPECRAVVILPARDEESSLALTLDALAAQRDLAGRAMTFASFEILLLLNNCTDRSQVVAEAWKRSHPQVRLHVAAMCLPPHRAHVGTARRLLMNTACVRLEGVRGRVTGILSTDADTLVSRSWIAENLRALEAGADAVGGVIDLNPEECGALPRGARRGYEQDRRYQELIALLEDALDPQAGDGAPRHLQHFGASLACTPAIYAAVGGLPELASLEDVAFVDALRRVDARVRHETRVRVLTSARMDGRTRVGLSGQLREWQEMGEQGTPYEVASAEWLVHRFGMLRRLREISQQRSLPGALGMLEPWRALLEEASIESHTTGGFLARVDCDRIIAATFRGLPTSGVEQAIERLEALAGVRDRKDVRSAVPCYAGRGVG